MKRRRREREAVTSALHRGSEAFKESRYLSMVRQNNVAAAVRREGGVMTYGATIAASASAYIEEAIWRRRGEKAAWHRRKGTKLSAAEGETAAKMAYVLTGSNIISIMCL